jgi:hypothetical protein
MENYAKKHSRKKADGTNTHRVPFFMLDTGVNAGLRKRFDTLMGGRRTGLPRGDGGKGYPAIGSRLLLKPMPNCIKSSLIKWQESALGVNTLNIVGPFFKWLQRKGLFPPTEGSKA